MTTVSASPAETKSGFLQFVAFVATGSLAAATNLIAPFANLATARSLFALGRLADGRVLLVGGATGQPDSGIANTTETLALDGTRRDGPAMGQGRWLHTVTTLADGRVLIVGGLGADRLPIRGAEIYE